jgi:DNA-binding beta-propeller fold protein YncE
MHANKLFLIFGLWLLGAALTEARTFTKIWFGRTEPDGIVVSPDNSTVYVAAPLPNYKLKDHYPSIVVIDATTGRVTDRFQVDAAPQGLAISADGSTLYVS